MSLVSKVQEEGMNFLCFLERDGSQRLWEEQELVAVGVMKYAGSVCVGGGVCVCVCERAVPGHSFSHYFK